MHFAHQPILSDFNRFLDYIGQSQSLELTKDKSNLRSADLLRLNEHMHFCLEVFNPKSTQQTFALLNTFFHIGRNAQLFSIQKNARTKQPVLTVNQDRIRQYDTLTDDEKYFFLLESFWCFVDWDEAYDCRTFWDQRFYEALMRKTAGAPVSISDRKTKRKGQIDPPVYIFAAEVLAAFGFFELIWDDQLKDRPDKYQFPYKTVVLSELGKAMLPVLFEQRSLIRWGDLDPYFSEAVAKRMIAREQEYDAEAGEAIPELPGEFLEDEAAVLESYTTPFSAAFLTIFPDLNIQNRLYPIERPFVDGRFVLRIALDSKCYREIAISSKASLDDLHGVIQDLFEFDDDHLYAFYMGNPKSSGSKDTYSDPRGMVGWLEKPAHLYYLGEIGLLAGKEFVYVFDFGDHWEFRITVLNIDPVDSHEQEIDLLKSVGEPPKQYPDWEEED